MPSPAVTPTSRMHGSGTVSTDALRLVLDDLTVGGIAPDPRRAAADLNWLVLCDAINRAMFLGIDEPITEQQIRTHADHACATFLSAYRTTKPKTARQ